MVWLLTVTGTVRCLLWASLAVSVNCAPYFLLSNTRPKCFTVEGPRSTILTLKYHAPDYSLIPDKNKAEKKEETPQEELEIGLDQRFNQRFLDRMKVMRAAGHEMIDIYITIQQKGDTASLAREWKMGAGGTGAQPSRVREGLKIKEGSLQFTTGGRDAPVEICFQSMAATPENPSRVALSVSQQVKRKLQLQKPDAPENQAKMSVIERDLKKLGYKVDMLLTNADYAKEQEVYFHESSLAMNRASQYWPIIHLVVLLVTGFTQANHIIRFFKSRHIY